jgi:hypothetical protein
MLFVLMCAFFLTGCPYLSDIPLNSAQSAILDTNIIGSWQKPGVEADSSEILHILQFSESECLVLIWEEKELSAFRAFSTPIRERKFLNVSEIHTGYSENQQYIFAEYLIEKDQLRLRFVEDDLFVDRKFVNSGELKDFIWSKLDNDSLFGGFEYFVRSEITELKR